MDLEQQLGNLFIIGFPGPTLHAASPIRHGPTASSSPDVMDSICSIATASTFERHTDPST